jgi:hypothetical protein
MGGRGPRRSEATRLAQEVNTRYAAAIREGERVIGLIIS